MRGLAHKAFDAQRLWSSRGPDEGWCRRQARRPLRRYTSCMDRPFQALCVEQGSHEEGQQLSVHDMCLVECCVVRVRGVCVRVCAVCMQSCVCSRQGPTGPTGSNKWLCLLEHRRLAQLRAWRAQ